MGNSIEMHKGRVSAKKIKKTRSTPKQQLVWAKIGDWPLWPALKLGENKKKRTVHVKFLDEEETDVYLSKDLVFDFCPKEDLVLLLKTKGLNFKILSKATKHYRDAMKLFS